MKEVATTVSIRIGNLELRSPERGAADPAKSASIVGMNGDGTHYVVAWFRCDRDDVNIEFVGDRPLREDWPIFEKLMRIGYQILPSLFQEEGK